MRLEEDFRFNLQGQLSHEKTELDVTIASRIAREFAVSFAKCVDKHYFQGDDIDCYYISVNKFRDGEFFTVKQLLDIYENK